MKASTAAVSVSDSMMATIIGLDGRAAAMRPRPRAARRPSLCLLQAGREARLDRSTPWTQAFCTPSLSRKAVVRHHVGFEHGAVRSPFVSSTIGYGSPYVRAKSAAAAAVSLTATPTKLDLRVRPGEHRQGPRLFVARSARRSRRC